MNDPNRRVVGGIEFRFDPSRGKWLGPPMPFAFGNLGTVNPAYLRVGNNIHTSVLGMTVPRDWTITEASFNNSNAVTATMAFRDGTTTLGSLAVTAADNAADTTLDIDVDAGAELKLYVSATSGTPQNVTGMFVARARM